MRLNKFLSQSGYCSRRQADELIAAGKVLVNKAPLKMMGAKVDPNLDEVQIKGGPILRLPKNSRIILMNKPKGTICTKKDKHASKTVYELLPQELQSFVSIGRLDKDTEGLLLFTNDGDLANEMAHPRHGKEKTYLVTCRGQLSEKDLTRMRKGIRLLKGRVSPAEVREIHHDPKNDRTVYEVTIREGKNRQIHNMFLACKKPVKKLVRVAFGPYQLGKLKPGQWMEVKLSSRKA